MSNSFKITLRKLAYINVSFKNNLNYIPVYLHIETNKRVRIKLKYLRLKEKRI